LRYNAGVRSYFIIVLVAVVGCRAKNTVPPQPPPTLRLPDTAAPLRYRASLEIDPAATTFHGRVEIDVSIRRAGDVLWLNGQDLTVQHAGLRRDGGETALQPEVLPRNFIALRGAVPAGDATIVVDYTGKQDAGLSNGMQKTPDGGDDYVVTHFEPIGARRVFPCFDEPAFKVPWQLELTVPAADVALTNTQIESEQTLPDGRRRTKFKPTRPLPSYLIALAVGRFETVDAGANRSGVPMRIVVPRGRGGDAKYAASEVGKVLAALEDYTGIPYPYDKLDQIVVPAGAGGAMEHPGLVTYAARLLLIPDGESASVRRSHVGVVAHELAHQWFGDLVTTAWWDDLWLNEAFATWATPKVIEAIHPEMDGALEPVQIRANALGSDVLTSARRIRQPITADADMSAAFDGITYQKGATVIRMFEHWIGPDVFQRAARSYLHAHADHAAVASDFLAELDRETGKPIGAAMTTFLDQAGVPQVDMELRCEPNQPASLHLAQHRYVPDKAPAANGPAWQIPICVRAEGETQPRCTLLAQPTGELALGPKCPAWIEPNVDGVGYYVPNLSAELLGKLTRDGWPQLSRGERLALVGDVAILVDGGHADLGVALDLLPRLAGDDPYLVEQAAGRLAGLWPLVADGQRDAFAKLVRDLLASSGKRLGWEPRSSDSVADARLRARVMTLLADDGADAAARDQAVGLAQKWLADPKSLPESLWGPVLTSALRANPRELFGALVERAGTEKSRVAQRTIYSVLAQVRDLDLYVTALSLVLQGDMTAEKISVLRAWPDTFALQAARLDFLRAHQDELIKRLPHDHRGALLANVCDASRRDDAAKYVAGLSSLPEIGELTIKQVTESMDLCIARRAAHEPALAKFLAGRAI
jgi:alanyl aminopeptidase